MQSASPTVFVNSSKEGIARVKAGNYAYLMESSMLEFYMGTIYHIDTCPSHFTSMPQGMTVISRQVVSVISLYLCL